MVCSHCVDANIPENKNEFVKGCETAWSVSVRKHKTCEMHIHAAEVLKNRIKEVQGNFIYLTNLPFSVSHYFVFH